MYSQSTEPYKINGELNSNKNNTNSEIFKNSIN